MRGWEGVTMRAWMVLPILIVVGLVVVVVVGRIAQETAGPPVFGYVRGEAPSYRVMLWADDEALATYNRAVAAGDFAGMIRVADQSDLIMMPSSTTVRLLAQHGDVVQVQLASGNMAGRRGWANASDFTPDP